MDFAKNFLSKYGWTEGQGIGKNLDGIVQPIKANLKFDKDGLGHDKAKDFTTHWWENAYNEAANNIAVEHNSSAGIDTVAISLKNGESFDVSTNGISRKKMRNRDGLSGYGTNFQKMRSPLTNNPFDDSDDEEQQSGEGKRFIAPTDEELMKACGGRTAHKGARHGLSLSGKLARIEEQERQLLEKYSSKLDSNAAQEMFKDWVKVDTRKKKKKKEKTAPQNESNIPITTSPDSEKFAALLNETDYVVKYKSRKKKKQHKALDEDLATTLSKCLSTNQNNDVEPQTTKADGKMHGILASSSVIKKKSKTKIEKKLNKNRRKYKKDIGIIVDEDVEITEVDGIAPPGKYLKHSQNSAAVAEEKSADEVDTVKKAKKRKRNANKCSADGADCPKVPKHVKSKLMRNHSKVERITRKLQNVMSLDEADPDKKSKKKKKKNKESN